MAHDLVRLLDAPIRYLSTGSDYGTAPRVMDAPIRKPYHVDTGLIVTGPITENAAPGSNTRVALLSARTLSPVNVVRALGNSYLFRSVAISEDGYFVMGIDLDGNYQPVCQGPVFPVAQ